MEYKRERLKGANRCAKCGHEPIAIHYDYDMWYIECGNKECDKYDKYLFLGQTKELAAEQWNKANRITNRGNKKGYKNENNGTKSTDVRDGNSRHP
jgi:hypothetical protein